MASVTLAYSVTDSGWKSRFSYLPDTGVNLNNSMYTFKYGELYKHDTNQIRNAFYWDYDNDEYFTYPSSITVILNDDPLETKDFRTIALDSNYGWDTTVVTDLNTGTISSDYYVNKEGTFYSYIRRDDNSIDLKAASTQGVGALLSYDGGSTTMTFSFTVDNSISSGDLIYKSNGTALVALGTVGSISGKTIVMSSVTTTPVSGDMIVIVKNSTAESFGARGYYMEVTLNSDRTDHIEIFSISSELSRSMP